MSGFSIKSVGKKPNLVIHKRETKYYHRNYSNGLKEAMAKDVLLGEIKTATRLENSDKIKDNLSLRVAQKIVNYKLDEHVNRTIEEMRDKGVPSSYLKIYKKIIDYINDKTKDGLDSGELYNLLGAITKTGYVDGKFGRTFLSLKGNKSEEALKIKETLKKVGIKESEFSTMQKDIDEFFTDHKGKSPYDETRKGIFYGSFDLLHINNTLNKNADLDLRTNEYERIIENLKNKINSLKNIKYNFTNDDVKKLFLKDKYHNPYIDKILRYSKDVKGLVSEAKKELIVKEAFPPAIKIDGDMVNVINMQSGIQEPEEVDMLLKRASILFNEAINAGPKAKLQERLHVAYEKAIRGDDELMELNNGVENLETCFKNIESTLQSEKNVLLEYALRRDKVSNLWVLNEDVLKNERAVEGLKKSFEKKVERNYRENPELVKIIKEKIVDKLPFLKMKSFYFAVTRLKNEIEKRGIVYDLKTEYPFFSKELKDIYRNELRNSEMVVNATRAGQFKHIPLSVLTYYKNNYDMDRSYFFNTIRNNIPKQREEGSDFWLSDDLKFEKIETNLLANIILESKNELSEVNKELYIKTKKRLEASQGFIKDVDNEKIIAFKKRLLELRVAQIEFSAIYVNNKNFIEKAREVSEKFDECVRYIDKNFTYYGKKLIEIEPNEYLNLKFIKAEIESIVKELGQATNNADVLDKRRAVLASLELNGVDKKITRTPEILLQNPDLISTKTWNSIASTFHAINGSNALCNELIKEDFKNDLPALAKGLSDLVGNDRATKLKIRGTVLSDGIKRKLLELDDVFKKEFKMIDNTNKNALRFYYGSPKDIMRALPNHPALAKHIIAHDGLGLHAKDVNVSAKLRHIIKKSGLTTDYAYSPISFTINKADNIKNKLIDKKANENIANKIEDFKKKTFNQSIRINEKETPSHIQNPEKESGIAVKEKKKKIKKEIMDFF